MLTCSWKAWRALTDADLFLEGLARPDRQTLGIVAHGAPLHVPRQPLVHHPGPHRVLWRTEYGRLMRDSFAGVRTTYYTRGGNFCKSFDNRFKRQLLTKSNTAIQKKLDEMVNGLHHSCLENDMRIE